MTWTGQLSKDKMVLTDTASGSQFRSGSEVGCVYFCKYCWNQQEDSLERLTVELESGTIRVRQQPGEQ